MANEVFANGREISCKSGDGKSICEFPDVCMTPPTTAATPMGVPIPYPNTAFSRDATEGSRTVKIDQKEVMLQDASYYKTSTGDEAGCATSAKKGIISGTTKGKMYFIAWSMDVSIEGKHVARTADMTTHNHASKPGNGSVPTGDIEGVSPPPLTPEQEVKCAIKKCDQQSYDVSKTKAGKAMPAASKCSALGSKKHKCVQDTLKGKPNIYPEQPYAKGVSGLSRACRPDVVVGGKPPSQPCDVYDAIFPCSDSVKGAASSSLSGVMPSAPTSAAMTAKASPSSKESRLYQKIAGTGQVRPLSPEDCKNETCP